jgi:hypothetical protein
VPHTQFVHIAKKFLPFVPEFSATFSAPPEFSGGIPKSNLAQAGHDLRPLDYQPNALLPDSEGDLLHSQMPEKSSGPWNATFYIPPCLKILVPEARQGLAPGARLLWQRGM